MKKSSHLLAQYALLIIFALCSMKSWAQSSCANPPNCIQNGQLASNGATSGNMDTSAASTINNWFVSHGTPSIFGGRTSSPNDVSIWMWSKSGPGLNDGEGVFTCYNFQQGQTYRICLWIRNTTITGNQPNGGLNIEAVNNLASQDPIISSNILPNPPQSDREIITSSTAFNTSWNFVSYEFIPDQNYNQLWIYPKRDYLYHNPPSPVPPQYEIQIDDVSITRLVEQNEISISANPSTISWCQSTVISLNGVPSGATVTWSPSVGLNQTTGTSVMVLGCATTTYSATVTFPSNTSCGVCTTYTRIYTQEIIVNPPIPTVTGDTSIICGENLTLAASLPVNCAGITYSWAGPNGFSTVGQGFSIPTPDSRVAGTYTLTVSNGCGGTITQTVNVTYACPCILNPTIQTRGCNPVTFTVSNTTLSSIVGWFWEFGDGETSNLSNPTHLYDQNGNYVVCVTVIGKSPRGEMCCTQVCDTIQACGCSAAAPSFTWQPRGTDGAGFTNTSLASAAVCGWRWDFGDGNTSTALNPTHQYAAPGTYTVCLIAYTCYPNASTDKIDTCTAKYCQTIVIGSGGGRRLAGDENTSNHNDWQFKLFPNPASTELFVVLPEGTTGEVRLLSADGKELMRLQNTGGSTYVANLKDIAPGMYLIEVRSANATTKRMQFVKE